MSSDLLDGGRPKRLVLRQGRWYLEVARLVSTGDGVFAPRTHRIEGRTPIVEALRRSKHGRTLADGASKILASGAEGNDVSYDSVEGGWVPSTIAPSYIKQLARTDVRTPAEAALVAELTLLRAAFEGLVARVLRLEQAIASGQVPREMLHSYADHDEEREDEHATGHDASDEEDEEPREHDEPDEQGDQEEDRAGAEPPNETLGSPEVEAPPEAPPPEAPPPLRLPGMNIVTATLKQLCGADVPLKELKNGAKEWAGDPARYCASWLVDDQGGEVGAILCDAEVIVRLGGALLMLPQGEIETQVSNLAPSEDVLSAASEVCNNLSGPLNKLPGNPHVRSTPLERLDDLMPEWLKDPRSQFVCAHPGGGQLVFVGR